MTESQKLVRDLWNHAAKQRRLLTEATHAIVGLTRTVHSWPTRGEWGDSEDLADHTAVLDEVEAVDLQIAGAVSEHAILDARVRCFYSTHCIDADDEEAQTWQRDEAGRPASIASPSSRPRLASTSAPARFCACWFYVLCMCQHLYRDRKCRIRNSRTKSSLQRLRASRHRSSGSTHRLPIFKES